MSSSEIAIGDVVVLRGQSKNPRAVIMTVVGEDTLNPANLWVGWFDGRAYLSTLVHEDALERKEGLA